MRANRGLAFAQILTFAITAVTSIPLIVSYLKGVNPANHIFVHLHVWFGLAFIVIALIKMLSERRLILRQLGLK